MKLLICICTYNRNNYLVECVRSISKMIGNKAININIVIVDNSKNFIVNKIKKKLIKISKYKLIFIHEKKRGIVNARNKFLKNTKKFQPNFISFLDDDCVVDKYWLTNILKIKKNYKVEIITGPQLYYKKKQSNNFINYTSFFEKKYNKSLCKVSWAASNNVFIKYSILKKKELFFDNKLNKYGIGEDQLFFSMLKKRGNTILWSENVKVYEKSHPHRADLIWLVKRSFRLGVLGHYVDKEIYGLIIGYNLNYLKSFYYLLKAMLNIFLIFNKTSRINTINFFSRFVGRTFGPFIFSKIDFLKK